MLITDYLLPWHHVCVRCGPLCLTSATCTDFNTTNLIFGDGTGTNLTVTNLTVLNPQVWPPIVSGPNNYVWTYLGPVDHPTHTFDPIPMGPGSWNVEVLAAGTGAANTDLAHYLVRASITNSGTLIAVITSATVQQTKNGSFIADGTTNVSLADDGSGLGRLRVVVTTAVASNWNAYVRCVGAPHV
jgi:hypothetical protein